MHEINWVRLKKVLTNPFYVFQLDRIIIIIIGFHFLKVD